MPRRPYLVFAALGFFCVYANLIGLVTGSLYPTYARDAIVLSVLLAALYRHAKIHLIFSVMLASMILAICIAKGFPNDILPKIRNYVAFPFVVSCVSISFSLLKKGIYGNAGRFWINYIFYSLVIFMIAEAAIYMIFPDLQHLTYFALSLIAEAKGVSVGLGGGLVNGARIITPLLSPVQGSIVLFIALVFMAPVSKRFGLFYIAHVLTFSKISLLAGILERARKASYLSLLAGVVFVVGLVVLFFAFAPGYLVITNIQSILIHLSGAVLGIMAPFHHPFGLSLDEVGAISGMEVEYATPGFESFVGSFAAAFGLFGLISLVLMYALYGYRNFLVSTFFLLWLLSDNVSSPHLFVIPALYLLQQPRQVRRNPVVALPTQGGTDYAKA